MTREEKIDLLTTPVWSLKQLMNYLGVKSRSTGIRLKNKAFEKFNGRVPYGNQYVKRDAILEMIGTSAGKELNEILQTDKL